MKRNPKAMTRPVFGKFLVNNLHGQFTEISQINILNLSAREVELHTVFTVFISSFTPSFAKPLLWINELDKMG